jgi:hypothetical protein
MKKQHQQQQERGENKNERQKQTGRKEICYLLNSFPVFQLSFPRHTGKITVNCCSGRKMTQKTVSSASCMDYITAVYAISIPYRISLPASSVPYRY